MMDRFIERERSRARPEDVESISLDNEPWATRASEYYDTALQRYRAAIAAQ